MSAPQCNQLIIGLSVVSSEVHMSVHLRINFLLQLKSKITENGMTSLSIDQVLKYSVHTDH